MAKSKAQPPIVCDDGANDVSMRFYVSDAASGNAPRVEVLFLRNGQEVDRLDAPASEFVTVTNQEKLDFRATAIKFRNEAYTKRGYV